MSIVEYLQSDAAVRDVAAALERHARGECDPPRDRWSIARGVISDDNNPWLQAFCMGEHEEAEDEDGDYISRTLPGEPQIVYPTHAAVHVYFRAEGDRYVVTDLGEAVRALRLRTGINPAEGDRAADAVMMDMVRGAPRWWIPNACVGSAIEIPQGIPAADLPRAIVRVMLAAYRVASLEAP